MGRLFQTDVPRQQWVEMFIMPGRQIGQLLKKVSQIGIRIQTIFLGRFNQAVNDSAGSCPFWCIGEQPVFPLMLGTALSELCTVGDYAELMPVLKTEEPHCPLVATPELPCQRSPPHN